MEIKFNEDIPYNELIFTLMRGKGCAYLDGFPCFVTEAHTEADLNTMQCFEGRLKRFN